MTPPSLRSASLSDCTIHVDGVAHPLRSGAIHYWRLQKDHWETALLAIKQELGLSMVETYVPWAAHEYVDANGNVRFDFGDRRPSLDLSAFLRLCQKHDLKVILRPGPHINAELTGFGLPDRVLHDEAIWARDSFGGPVTFPVPPQMFQVPSHHSIRYRDLISEWYAAVAHVVQPFASPHGPVVLLNLDNELAFYFRNGQFCQDYHPDSLAAYERFLGERFSSGELHSRYGGHIEPPRDESAPLTAQLDWAAFAEWTHTDFLRYLKALAEDIGFAGLLTSHNLAMGDFANPVSLAALSEVVDIVGLDYYYPAKQIPAIRRRALFQAGSSRSAWAPELGVGGPPWFTPLTEHDSITTALTAFAYGVRGYNLYMAVDRDRWFGAPIAANGRSRAHARTWKRLGDTLAKLSFEKLERRVEVAIVIPREYLQLVRISHALDAFSASSSEAFGESPVAFCDYDPRGLEVPVQHHFYEDWLSLEEALRSAGVPFDLIDGDSDPSGLRPYKLVYSPCYAFASRKRLALLCAMQERGSKVVLGPQTPTFDERLLPLTSPSQTVCERPIGAYAHALVADWTDSLALDRPYPSLPPVDTVAHVGADGKTRVLFVVNSGSALTARVRLRQKEAFVDWLSGDLFEGDTELSLPMNALSVRMLLATGDE